MCEYKHGAAFSLDPVLEFAAIIRPIQPFMPGVVVYVVEVHDLS
jgi:hypothetical protein